MMFDPVTGKVLDPDALRSIGVRAGGFTRARAVDERRDGETVRRVEVLREDNGRHAGEHIHHADGSVDAIARPEPLTLSTTTQE